MLRPGRGRDRRAAASPGSATRGRTPRHPGTDVRELGGILMPGLVNCHGHSPMTLVRSAGDGLPLDRWLAEAVWPREGRMDDEDVYWGMALGAVELLGNGVTTTLRAVPPSRRGGRRRWSTRASGASTPRPSSTCRGPTTPGRRCWQSACRLFDEMDGKRGRLRVGFGPHAAYTVPPEGLAAVAAEAQRRDALLQIHLSETRGRVRTWCDERYGISAPAAAGLAGRARRPGAGRPCRVARRRRPGRLAEHDVAVAHCPGSNGKLGAGVAPLRRRCSSAACASAWAPTGRPPTTTSTCGTRCASAPCWPGPLRPTRAS